MTRTYDIAVYSANTIMGEALIRQLGEGEEPVLPVLNLYPLTEYEQVDGTVDFDGQELEFISWESFNFTKVDFLFMPAGVASHAGLIALAAEAGCRIIDGSCGASLKEHILPLIPGVKTDQLLSDATLEEAAHSGYLAFPSSSVALLLPLLRVIHHQYGLSRVNLTICQSVANLGHKAVEALQTQTLSLLNGQSVDSYIDGKDFFHRIAYNLLPASQDVNDEGLAAIEKNIHDELLIAISSELDVRVSCITAPVFFGDSFVVDLDTVQAVDLPVLSDLMAGLPCVEVLSEREVATVEGIAGSDRIVLSKLRHSCAYGTGLSFWLVADGIRIGAAHGIELANLLIKYFTK